MPSLDNHKNYMPEKNVMWQTFLSNKLTGNFTSPLTFKKLSQIGELNSPTFLRIDLH